MFLYAVGILPLISSLKRPSLWTQMWYVDDASACGRLVHIRQWFKLLLQRGRSFGYYPNPRKSSLVVDSVSRASAEQLFGPLGIRIVCDQRFLGGFLAVLMLQIHMSWREFISGSWTLRICRVWPSPNLRPHILHL